MLGERGEQGIRPLRTWQWVDDHHLAALFREAEYHADHIRSGFPDHPYHLP